MIDKSGIDVDSTRIGGHLSAGADSNVGLNRTDLPQSQCPGCSFHGSCDCQSAAAFMKPHDDGECSSTCRYTSACISVSKACPDLLWVCVADSWSCTASYDGTKATASTTTEKTMPTAQEAATQKVVQTAQPVGVETMIAPFGKEDTAVQLQR